VTTERRGAVRPVDPMPPGYVNPYRLRVYADEADSLAKGLIRMELWQGVSGMRYRCLGHATTWRCITDVPLVRPPLR
jgi:hypothetical protein